MIHSYQDDSFRATNITVVTALRLQYPNIWKPYTVYGGVFIYDSKYANNVTVQAGVFHFISENQNAPLSINVANVNGDSLEILAVVTKIRLLFKMLQFPMAASQ